MRIVSKSGLMALMALAPMALASDAISAQEPQQEQQMSQCTARVASGAGQAAGVMGEQQQQQRPTQQQSQGIQSGQKATQVTLQLTSPVGNIKDFSAEKRDAQTGEPLPEEQREIAGVGDDLKLAEGDDLPETQREMARTGEQENEAIQMSTQNTVTLWLNTEDASAGHYHFTLEGENGQCTGQLEVKGGAR